MAKQRVAMIGGGLAGLAGAMKLAEEGVAVDLVSMVPVKRSHSVCAQGGINSVNTVTRSQGDSEWKHLDDTVYGGDFLNHQPPVKEMTDWGPKIIDLLDRLGVPFNRTPEGNLDRRRFGGTLYKRTAFAGATTGQQLLYALDEQVRRWETEGLITKYEHWEFLGLILDDAGVCKGCVIQDMFSMQLKALRADAVVMATGGCGLIFGKSTMSMICTGGANARAFQEGVKYANGEFIQVHPTAIPGADKLRLMSESARGEGGRVWVPRKPQDPRDPMTIPESERYYFLEERYPTYGNLVPRDIATREIFDVCVNGGLSVEKEDLCVYLDLTHLPPTAHHKLEGILEIYEKFAGGDPRTTPMKIFPAVHYSMGGLWVDYEKDAKTGGLALGSPRNQMTNVPGVYAIGEADYQYHGANRLGANSLLSCIFAGLITAPSIINYFKGCKSAAADAPAPLFDGAVKRHHDKFKALAARTGEENAYELHQELGRTMTANCTVVRYNDKIKQTLAKLDELAERYQKAPLSDTGQWTNQNLSFVRALGDMIVLARVIALGALQRDECRGAHYKPDFEISGLDPTAGDMTAQARKWCQLFKKRNDDWLKTTIAEHTPSGPKMSYEAVDVSLIPPRPRTYGLKGAEEIERIWKTEFSAGSAGTEKKQAPVAV
ncbi:MAG: succinate dehydrogenase flavoprotein subunit [Phycisphaerae bacterium]|nr:MAG: succinate dehydrogenase flavoprotein subunit [Planctomycetia bacterium]RIK70531.1 MAG: succinate dehydrogenase flavoprotein subunit [Planctomycetota bacterium]GJQ26205.1 MAG: succinate dehydrogenase flavoprotein subunit [Phycisphaerae bacterium]